MVITLLIGALFLFFSYKRYAPVFGVSRTQSIANQGDTILVDLRDYQTASKDPISGSINIPYAYLKRNYKDIPDSQLIIVASDPIEKNLAIRYLIKRQFKVSGYFISTKKSDLKVV